MQQKESFSQDNTTIIVAVSTRFFAAQLKFNLVNVATAFISLGKNVVCCTRELAMHAKKAAGTGIYQ